MARFQRVQSATLILANIVLPLAVLVFASGFFPYKPVLPGLAHLEDEHAKQHPQAPFDRVVFMVVDALRSDFVYGANSGFEFTQSLIRAGAAIPFTAHATPPTVTMPRVKALTTGSVPSFVDLILNFAESDTSSSLASQDTWLAQIRAKGGKLVFYGDDTWLKLFPGDFFARHDGTSSFFVSDFTEVDHNVTRQVPEELENDDWSGMILHYLGLDHIGHKTGPQGPNMLPKQREMDGIVKMIYQAMETADHHSNTLLVLAGDHGMNAGGNHGGSGPGETEPALLFASPKFKDMRGKAEYECPSEPKDGTEFHFYTKVEQSDLVPTLAGLMGLPISRNSLGVFIPEFTGLWRANEQLHLLWQNARQILDIIRAAYGPESFQSAVLSYQAKQLSLGTSCEDIVEHEARLACLWAKAESSSTSTTRSTTEDAHAATMRFLLEAQDTMSGAASSYNIPNMIIGMALAALMLLLSIISLLSGWPPTPNGVFLSSTSILYGVMMFASSYVEEEQHFWYWLTPAWVVLLGLQRTSSARSLTRLYLATFSILMVHRFAVRWNQTGQKFAGDPDIVHTFFPDAHVLMWLFILSAYLHNGYSLITKTFAGILSTEVSILFSVALVVPAIVFKLNFTQADAPELVRGLASQLRVWTEPFDLVVQARLVFLTLVVTTTVVIALSIASHRASARVDYLSGVLPTLSERLHHLLTLFLITQTRAPNIPLFLGWEIQHAGFAHLLAAVSPTITTERPTRSVTIVATTTLLLSHAYFFCMGGSNSISSIDLSNAYNGVADYNIAAVGVLLFASNWTAPVWWCSAASLSLMSKSASSGITRKPRPKGERAWIDEERDKLHEQSLQTRKIPSANEPSSMGAWQMYVSCMTTFIASSLLAVMAACTALRTHLFIWTVFSPKYLYAMAWSIGWHLIINIGLGSLLAWLSNIA